MTTVLVASLLLIAFPISAASASPPGLVKDINPGGSSNPAYLTRVGDTLFFAANDGIHGRELWRSNGTSAGTRLVKDIRTGAKGSDPQWLTAVGNTLYFTAADGTHGRELWKSDGTRAGTRMVKDLVTPGGLVITEPPVAAGSRLFFIREVSAGFDDLYVTDGKAAGTVQLTDSDLYVPYWSTAVVYQGKLYFVAYDDDMNRIWVSDGTVAGTHELVGAPIADEIYIVPVTANNLYFITVDAAPPQGPFFKLWKTNGTPGGTKALTSSGQLEGGGAEAALLNGRLYFSADGLWKTNGTARGTKRIFSQPAPFLTVAGDHLYFSAAVVGQGLFLWTSDGTAVGTEPVFGFGETWPRQITAVGEEVCFKVENFDEGWWELWESDGTANGTYKVTTFADPMATLGDGPMGVAIGSRLFFPADDGTHGVELWSYTP